MIFLAENQAIILMSFMCVDNVCERSKMTWYGFNNCAYCKNKIENSSLKHQASIKIYSIIYLLFETIVKIKML